MKKHCESLVTFVEVMTWASMVWRKLDTVLVDEMCHMDLES